MAIQPIRLATTQCDHPPVTTRQIAGDHRHKPGAQRV